jgi:putative PIN family toxin of toxin-antitoxin system
MRIVCDTNCLISGLLWSGPPSTILEAVEDGKHHLFISREMLTEFANVLARAKFAAILRRASLEPEELVRWLLGNATTIFSRPLSEPVVLDDPADDMIIACAVSAGAEAIISGDRHLLKVGRYRDIPILPAAVLAERYGGP